MVAVHAARVARHLGEGRHPLRTHLLSHAKVRLDDVLLLGGAQQGAQRVGGAVGVPNPVVGVKGVAIVVVYLSVEGAEVAAVLAEADGALHGTVERGVEHGLLVVGATLDTDSREFVVPCLASGLGYGGDAKALLFAVEVGRGLLGTNERDAVAQRNLFRPSGEADGHAGSPSLGAEVGRNLSAPQHATGFGCCVELTGEVDVHVATQSLAAGERQLFLAVGFHLTPLGVEHQGGRLRRVEKLKFIDGALWRYGQADADGVVGHLYVIVVGRDALLVPRHRDDGTQFLALRHAQAEGRALAVVRHHHRQAVEHLCGVVAARGVDAHEAVGQLYGCKRRHQQMADVTDIGIYIVNGLFLNKVATGTRTRHFYQTKPAQSKSKKQFFHSIYDFSFDGQK